MSGMETETNQIVRGGSFEHNLDSSRSTYCGDSDPASHRNYDGFRVVVNRVQKRIEENNNA